MKYLFKNWQRLKKKLIDKHVFLFLDYDGTLAPIAKSPDRAVISYKTKNLLKKLSAKPNYKLAIISGRGLKDIKRMVGLKNVIYAGNHGFEIEGPKIKFSNPVSSDYKIGLKKIKKDLKKKLSSVKGILLEDKGFSLALHYRLVKKELIPRVKTIFQETITHHLVKNKIRVKPGKMVLEIRIAVDWDKGKVVLWLLAREKFSHKNKKSFIPIYIGDDLTDENAFNALKNKGLTVVVSKATDSSAQFYLKNAKEVSKFLKYIAEL